MISAGKFLPCPTEDLPHLFLCDAMIENVRQIGFWIYPESQLHSIFLFGQTLLSLLRIEPLHKLCSPGLVASLTAGNNPCDPRCHRPWRDCVAQRGVRRLTGQILLAGEEPHERSGLVCDVVLDCLALHRMACLKRVEH